MNDTILSQKLRLYHIGHELNSIWLRILILYTWYKIILWYILCGFGIHFWTCAQYENWMQPTFIHFTTHSGKGIQRSSWSSSYFSHKLCWKAPCNYFLLGNNTCRNELNVNIWHAVMVSQKIKMYFHLSISHYSITVMCCMLLKFTQDWTNHCLYIVNTISDCTLMMSGGRCMGIILTWFIRMCLFPT